MVVGGGCGRFIVHHRRRCCWHYYYHFKRLLLFRTYIRILNETVTHIDTLWLIK